MAIRSGGKNGGVIKGTRKLTTFGGGKIAAPSSSPGADNRRYAAVTYVFNNLLVVLINIGGGVHLNLEHSQSVSQCCA